MASALEQPGSAESRRDAAFQSTLWTQVRQAGGQSTGSHQALEALCRVYWPPIYAFLRRSGHDCHDAKDLTQAFFVYLIEQELLKKADPDRGRFRSFLLGALKFFVSNQQAKARALKRGGGTEMIPLESEQLEETETSTAVTPERAFERKWALAVLAEAMRRLEAEYRRSGLADEFALLQPYLTGEADARLPVLARQLGKTDSTARVVIFRVRNRFRRLVRAVVADTVSDVEQVESELRHLEAALRGD